MRTVTYVEEALQPGGTPKRYLVWVSIILIVQMLASILPSSRFMQPWNIAHTIFVAVIILALLPHALRNDKQRILAAYALYIVGLFVSTITISTGLTSLSGIIYMLTWAMTLFIAERREYISFDLVSLFMVLMLISTVILLMFEPSLYVTENVVILGSGALLTGINIYLVYIDLDAEKNFYQESRRKVTNLQLFTARLADILTKEKPINELLWEVTEECVPYLDLEECVIYLYNEERKVLQQVAAYGGKSTEENKIIDPIEITPGRGVVGKCFESGEVQIISEIKPDIDYIVDDAVRSSELAVPIFSKGKVIGVFDSEHSKKGFFDDRHVEAFGIAASFCGIKITEIAAIESIWEAEKVKMESERMKELDDLKNRFITNISHDLKTPLSLIKAPAIQIAKLSSDKQIKNNADYILKNTEHLLRVVNQLLQLNRVDLGLNELYLEDVELVKLISKIETQYKGLAEKDGIRFTCQTDNLVHRTDSFRLEQIIHNLVHNAFRYTGKKGAVELKVTSLGNDVIIKVMDNGPGIPIDMQKQVFERFVKGDVNNHEGTGIGLSLVKEYAKSLGGEVQLQSTHGNGTTFTVILPITKTERLDPQKEAALDQSVSFSSKPELLIVEDHPDLNSFIASTFENEFQCVSAFDGIEALNRLGASIPDIIITDLMMPKMDGNQLISEIRNNDEWAHIPIIVLSAKGQIDSKVELYNLGADNYLVKPFDMSELEAVVKNVCEQRRRLKHLFQSNYLVKDKMDHALSESNDSKPNTLVKLLVEFVISQLDNNDINVTMIAKELGVGRNKLQKEIKEETGLTPVELIRSIRLSEAKKLLIDPTKQISEVAYSVGFTNLSYFSRSFKNEFDCLPTEWQQHNKS